MFPPVSILTPRRIFKTTILTNPNDGKREKVPPNHFKHSVEHYVPTQGLPVCPLSRIAHTIMFFPSTASNLRCSNKSLIESTSWPTISERGVSSRLWDSPLVCGIALEVFPMACMTLRISISPQTAANSSTNGCPMRAIEREESCVGHLFSGLEH